MRGPEEPTLPLAQPSAIPSDQAATLAGPVTPAAPLAPQIDGYRITGRLGEGGMGVVWQAVQLSTRRDVALKVISAAGLGSDRARLRFEREVELSARLDHPGIARVFDGGLHRGVCFYAMELVPGLPLDRYLAETRSRSATHVLHLMLRVCQAVQHAHQKGIIHRDLKPGNILVTADGQPKILDFGLAKAVSSNGDDSRVAISIDGEVAGTPIYMSPEQAGGHPDRLDTRSDVYTLGVILFHLLTGRFPHDASGSYIDVMQRIAAEEPKRLRQVMPEVDADLDALVTKATAPEPDRRYSSAGELAADIGRYLAGEPLAARPPTLRYVLRKRLRRHRARLVVAAIVLVALATFAVTSDLRVRRAHTEAVSARKLAEDQRGLAEQNRQQAELKRAESLVSEGDALGATWRWSEALDRYREARAVMGVWKRPTDVADVAAWQAYREGAAPLFTAAEPSITAADLSADGRTALTGHVDGTLWLWDLLRGRRVRVIGKPDTTSASTRPDLAAATVRCVAFAPDGRHAMSCGRDHVLSYWDLNTGELLRTFVGHSPLVAVRQVVFAADGRTVLSLGNRGEMKVWDVDTARCLVDLNATGLNVPAVALSADGRIAVGAVLYGDVTVRAWDTGTGKVLRDFVPAPGGPMFGGRPYDLPANAVAITPDGRHVLAGSLRGRLRWWDVQTGEERWSVDGHGDAIAKLAISADGRTGYSTSADRIVKIWDLRNGSVIRAAPGPHGDTQWLAPSADGRLLLNGGVGQIGLYPLDDAGDALTLPRDPRVKSDEPGGADHFAVSPDRQLLAAGESYNGRRIVLRDLATGQRLRDLRPGGSSTTAVGFLHGGRHLIVSTVAGGGAPAPTAPTVSLETYDVFTGERVATLPQPSGHRFLALDPAGALVLMEMGGGKSLKLIDPANGNDVRALDGDTGSVTEAAFSPDGTRIAAALNNRVQVGVGNYFTRTLSSSPELRVWDVATGRLIARHKNPTSADLVTLAWAPTGASIWLTSGRTAALIDTATGATLRTIDAAGSDLTSLATSADGRTLIAGGRNGTLEIWQPPFAPRPVRGLIGTVRSPRGVAMLADATGIAASSDRLVILNLGRARRYAELEPAVLAARSTLQRGDGNDDPAALATLGRWYAFRGQWAWAADLLRGARDGGALDVSPLLLARCHWQAGQFEVAEREFRRAIEKGEAPADYLQLCAAAAADDAAYAAKHPGIATKPASPPAPTPTPSTAPANNGTGVRNLLRQLKSAAKP